MYINTVLSYLGAWEKLQMEHAATFEELQYVLQRIDLNQFLSEDRLQNYSSGRRVKDFLRENLAALDWKTETRVAYGEGNRRFRNVDFVKEGIGVEFGTYRYDFIQSNLFVKYPLFVQLGHLQIVVVMMMLDAPSPQDRYYKRPFNAITFNIIRDQLKELYPLPLKYPFIILGISNTPAHIEATELSSPLDRFLIETLGLSLVEMKLSGEQERYDFKEMFPSDNSDNRKIFHLACAMANQPTGGVILFGIDDSGNIKGLLRSELDEKKRRITDTIGRNCQPCPLLSLSDFDDPYDPDKCVLAVYIHELEYKPCMADEKVYIRVGSETRPARSEEIRRLLLR